MAPSSRAPRDRERRPNPGPAPAAGPDFSEVDALTFTCLPGCGFCCTCSPGLIDGEPERLKADAETGPFVVPRQDGSLGLALRNGATACNFLGEDRRCGVYFKRPTVCRTFPFHFHLGERIQVNGNLGCPGLWPEKHTPDADPRVQAGPMARGALEMILTPDLQKEFAQAKETYAEFRRRTQSLGTYASERDLAQAYRPLLSALTSREGYEHFFALLALGQVSLNTLERDLHEQSPEVGALSLLEEIAGETFVNDPRKLPAYVDEGLRWVTVTFQEGEFTWWEFDEKRVMRPKHKIAFEDLDPFNLTPAARGVIERYLAGLLQRDHTWGHAAKIVDAMEYAVDMGAAYGRVLADTAGNVLLRAALVARLKGHPQITEADAREGVVYYDMWFLNLPTIGAVT
ncbi:MAG TPA: YkgJ family cysteine cluster protein [Candidatus Thermoplasmatota archaeon]|nr:YkgJ family cysteine cluster protein [Candidatus Thermoplasmatota archaeon]